MADSIDEKSLQSLKVVELKKWLQRRGVKTSGKKNAKSYAPLLHCDWLNVFLVCRIV